ncbi:MAG: PAS-domain containing protein [Paracoccaceae bacterium]
MELLSQPQIGTALMAGLCLAAFVLMLLLLSDRAAHRATGPVAPSPQTAFNNEDAVFLFSGSHLIQSTAAGTHLLDNLHDSSLGDRPDCQQSDWSMIIQTLRSRFAGLPDAPYAESGSGQVALVPTQSGDTAQLVMDWWDGHTRLTLSESLLNPIPLCSKDEDGWFRRAVTGAPYPIWQSSGTGQVIWANTAYRDLVARFTADPLPEPDHPALFDIPYKTEGESASCRMSLTPNGSVQPYWFDVRSLRLDSGWMNYATDVNAVVNAEIAQRNFVQTLTKTFAQLSIGLAIFDRKRQLALFNPALIDLTSLSAEFLSGRPNLLSFFDRLRDRQMMPEPKNYRSWRDQIADLVAAADNGQYRETWSLPSGLTYRISGRPHPDGAVAFLFEDISAEISLTRRFRSQLELGQSVLNTLDQSIAVFSPSGVLAFSNTAYRAMWGIDPDSSFSDISVTEASRQWQAGSLPTPVWGDLRDFVVQFGERVDWQADVTLRDGRVATCQVMPMAGGATMVLFQTQDVFPAPVMGELLHSPA